MTTPAPDGPAPGSGPSPAERAISHRTVLLIVLAVAAGLRSWGLDFGDPGKYRPDEEYVVSRALGFHSGSLNPGFFIYPTAYMYLLSLVYGVIRLAGEALGTFGAGGFMAHLEQHRYFPIHLYARWTTAVLGVLGVLATYRLGERLFGPKAGVLAAALLAVNPVHVRESHFATTDVPMTLLTTLALTALVGVAERGRLRDYALAGALTGAAVSTKYPALALGLPFLVAHLVAPRDEGRPFWSPRPLALLAAGGLAVVASFLALSPYFLLDHETVARDLAYQTPYLRSGMAGSEIPLGWRWLLGFGLWYGAGPLLLALFLAALMVAIARVFTHGPRAPTVVVASFAIGFGGVLMASGWVYFRYVLPLMPVLAVLVTGLAVRIAARMAPGRPMLAAALILAVSSLEPAVRAVSTSRLLATPDTRQEAAVWIRANIPSGTRIAVDKAFMYAKPELPPDYRYVDYGELPARAAGWALVDESPIRRFSPPLGDDVRRLLHDRGRLVAKYDPFAGSRFKDEAVFDPADAFYLPLSGLGKVRQPGPILKVYRIEAAPPPPPGGRPVGWRGRYFDNVRWEGAPAQVRVDPMIDFEWKPGPPFSAALYSVEWVGELHVERDGVYGFRIESDDGCFLFIDARLVVDNGGEHGPLSKAGSATLSRGDHPVEVRFFNSAYTGQVKLYWTPPGERERLLPADVVRPPPPSQPGARP